MIILKRIASYIDRENVKLACERGHEFMFYDTKFVAKYKGSVKCDKCAQNIDPKKGIYHCPVGGCD